MGSIGGFYKYCAFQVYSFTVSYIINSNNGKNIQFFFFHLEHKRQKGEDVELDIQDLYYIFEQTRRVYTDKYKETHGDYTTELPEVKTPQFALPKAGKCGILKMCST